jgi:hypothetical protein
VHVVAGQEFARAFVEETPHGVMEVGLIVKARLVRHLGERGDVVEIEQAHDPVDLKNLSKELRVDTHDMFEASIERALIGAQFLANICDANRAVRGLEHGYRTFDEAIAGTGTLRKSEKERVCLFDMLVARTSRPEDEMRACQRLDLRPHVTEPRGLAGDAFSGDIEKPMQGRGGQLTVNHFMSLRVMHGDVVIDDLTREMPA